ncbi:hypothetical protein H2200_002684 [Cladophialophora chaetospira]|uniref:Short-chain dehydrogenase n=1 Tax=Cladophialophora chaetospira TaxID=386627 RepID=A0AA38XJC9_9EURO|nr:hypothetical protein H2200_002684 [Cladophialophora chaetospira]
MATDPFAPYLSQHTTPISPGDSRPTAKQNLADEDLLDNSAWSGHTVLVTGATSGIGVKTVRALHATGANLYFTREAKRRRRSQNTSEGKLDVIMMDLESLQSVKKAAAEFLGGSAGRLNVLVNNAGIMGCPQDRTTDGFELQLGVIHLAHFALMAMLLPALIANSTAIFNSRILKVSSSSHRYSSIHFDDVNLTGNYDPFVKTANIWTANYIDRVYGPRGVHALSLHPSGIWSGLQRYAPANHSAVGKADPEIGLNTRSAEQDATTTVWAAVVKVWEGRGGKYLADCQIAASVMDLTSAMDSGVGPDAYNVEGEEKLWELSARFTGLSTP